MVDLGNLTVLDAAAWISSVGFRSADHADAGPEVETDELARLRAENARLRGAEKEWQLEREILRRAAAYFAKEVK